MCAFLLLESNYDQVKTGNTMYHFHVLTGFEFFQIPDNVLHNRYNINPNPSLNSHKRI